MLRSCDVEHSTNYEKLHRKHNRIWMKSSIVSWTQKLCSESSSSSFFRLSCGYKVLDKLWIYNGALSGVVWCHERRDEMPKMGRHSAELLRSDDKLCEIWKCWIYLDLLRSMFGCQFPTPQISSLNIPQFCVDSRVTWPFFSTRLFSILPSLHL